MTLEEIFQRAWDTQGSIYNCEVLYTVCGDKAIMVLRTFDEPISFCYADRDGNLQTYHNFTEALCGHQWYFHEHK